MYVLLINYKIGISLKRLEEVEREKSFYKSFPGLLSKIWGPATVSEVIRD
jgi:hypothetical protein